VDVVVLIGLQASGKSTFARARLTATHAHVSKDLFPSARNKARRQAREIDEALRAGRSVVVDNTNPTRTDRAAIIALARGAGARVHGYYFESRVETCKERNALRDAPARVPDVALFATAKVLERPSMAEGFDALYYVRALSGGGFDVSPWEEPS
jgi:predicted kinase